MFAGILAQLFYIAYMDLDDQLASLTCLAILPL
jgi:hypothetical protein